MVAFSQLHTGVVLLPAMYKQLNFSAERKYIIMNNKIF